MAKNKISWQPLESNPQLISKLGVPPQWSFFDVYGLDDELLAMVPQPCLAIILLFPLSKSYELQHSKLEEELKVKPKCPKEDSILFIRQTIGNACGTIAVLHALANNMENLELGNEDVKKLFGSMKSLSPEERADILESSAVVASAHQQCAVQGQTEAIEAEADVDLHFVCYINHQGALYELDGRKSRPVYHGPSSNLLYDAAQVFKRMMELDPSQLQFNVVALATE